MINNEQSDSKRLKPSFDKSVEVFEKVLDGGQVSEAQLKVALVASHLYTKSKAAENQRALLIYQVARDYSKDKEELRVILQASIQNVRFLPDKISEE